MNTIVIVFIVVVLALVLAYIYEIKYTYRDGGYGRNNETANS